jgi:hypothetical protein
MVAVRGPAANGANVTLNVQDPPALTAAQFDPVTGNSPALLLVIDVTVTVLVPVFMTVTAWGPLIVPAG